MEVSQGVPHDTAIAIVIQGHSVFASIGASASRVCIVAILQSRPKATAARRLLSCRSPLPDLNSRSAVLGERNLELEARVSLAVLGVVQRIASNARRSLVGELDEGDVLPPWDRADLGKVGVSVNRGE